MNEIAQLMTNAAHEIRDLRRRNEVLAAKVEMIDLFAPVFRTRPDFPSVGMSLDVVWELDKKAAELHEASAPQAPQSDAERKIALAMEHDSNLIDHLERMQKDERAKK